MRRIEPALVLEDASMCAPEAPMPTLTQEVAKLLRILQRAN